MVVIYPFVKYEGRDFSNTMNGNLDWDNFDLDRGATKTIFPYLTNGRPQKASIVIAVDYTYLYVKQRWLFKFEGTYIDNWQWSKQPIKAEEKMALNLSVNEAIRRHKEMNQQH